MRRLLLILLTALLGSAAPLAAAAPPERVKLEPAEFTIEGICDFDVEYSEVRVHGNSLRGARREASATRRRPADQTGRR